MLSIFSCKSPLERFDPADSCHAKIANVAAQLHTYQTKQQPDATVSPEDSQNITIVQGDVIQVGNLSGTGIAIGRDSSATVNNQQANLQTGLGWVVPALSKLNELSGLLDEGYAIFIKNNERRNKLTQLLYKKHQNSSKLIVGFDEYFYQMYDNFDKTELELFQLIRGTTKGSMYRNNKKLRKWADKNQLSKLIVQPTTSTARLEVALEELKLHLNLWFDKYDAIFLADEKRSLVYLGDEKAHGTRFPRDLEPAIKQVVQEVTALKER